ncbi:unnamed protein product [Nesidiocoris tenuis]|uniref:Uncharacterized protein n=1 Tax=Nesidiocoris tenuis TaxID=355587 RepID=A0A6H5HH31_9HEMI|nr:unnamed protein product [Nesidiocoris tenuis]
MFMRFVLGTGRATCIGLACERDWRRWQGLQSVNANEEFALKRLIRLFLKIGPTMNYSSLKNWIFLSNFFTYQHWKKPADSNNENAGAITFITYCKNSAQKCGAQFEIFVEHFDSEPAKSRMFKIQNIRGGEKNGNDHGDLETPKKFDGFNFESTSTK